MAFILSAPHPYQHGTVIEMSQAKCMAGTETYIFLKNLPLEEFPNVI